MGEGVVEAEEEEGAGVAEVDMEVMVDMEDMMDMGIIKVTIRGTIRDTIKVMETIRDTIKVSGSR